MKHHRYCTAGVADTIMAAAFLRALQSWAERHHADGMISIPTGLVDIAELTKVVLALGQLKRSQGENYGTL
jgi:hypothetical protein